MKKLLLTLSAMFSLLLFSSFAQAEIVSNWRYSGEVGFTNMKFEDGSVHGIAGSTGNSTLLQYTDENGKTKYQCTNDQFSWGESKKLSSSLTIATDFAYNKGVRKIETNGDVLVDTMNVTHVNKKMGVSYKSLTSGTILNTSAFQTLNYDFYYIIPTVMDFYFLETSNTGGYDNDIFFMTQDQIAKSVTTFNYNDVDYYVTIETSMQALTGEYLRMAQESLGVSSDTKLFGWSTEEGKTTASSYTLNVSISSTPPAVPVPAAIWLMGTGLAGLVACRKRLAKR